MDHASVRHRRIVDALRSLGAVALVDQPLTG
jgi:hypothetical protein